MKFLKITMFFLLLSIKLLAINDINQLKETVYSFGGYLIKDSASVPNEFLLNYNEFKSFYIATAYKEDLNEKKIKENYNFYLDKVDRQFKYLKNNFNNSYNIKSFDSFLFSEDKSNLMAVSISYFGKSLHQENEGELQALFTFVIYQSKLKFVVHCRLIDDFGFKLHQLEKVHYERDNQFYKTYKDKYYAHSFYNAVPIKVKNKWGLISLTGKPLLKPIYDSIYPFQSNYAIVQSNKKYNLLTKDFNLVFKDGYKKIRYTNGQYSVLNSKNKFENYPFVQNPQMDFPVETAILQQVEIAPENTKMPDTENTYLQKLIATYYNQSKYSIQNDYDTAKKEKVIYIIDNKTKLISSTHYGFLFLDAHNDFIYGYKNESAHIIIPEGNVLFKSDFVCNYNSPGYLNIYDKDTKLFGFYSPYTNIYIKPIYTYIKPIDRDKFFVVITKSGAFGYLDRNGKELF